ncbi:MAG: 6-bladed beta-propeller [Gemmatimonadaceae bacterium]|nr:6-bladed beta-propeller [Gemmatimonadaceae bacterium]
MTVETILGETASSNNEELSRVVAAKQDADGRVFVLDQAPPRILVFTRDGRFERQVGRPGNGPGELGIGSAGLLTQDSLLIVPDLNRSALQFFEKTGRLARQLQIAPAVGVTLGWQAAPNLAEAFQAVQSVSDMDTAGITRVAILRRSLSSGAVVDTPVARSARSSVRIADGIPNFTLFTPEFSWALLPDGSVVYATGEACHLEVAAKGRSLRRLERSCQTRQTTRSERDSASKLFAAALRLQRTPEALAQTLLRRLQFAPVQPVIISLLTTGDTVFVERGDQSATTFLRQSPAMQVNFRRSRTWEVITASGNVLGVVQFPVGIVPLHVRGNKVLASSMTEDGVEQLVVLKLAY